MTEQTGEQTHARGRARFGLAAMWSRLSHLPTKATLAMSALLLAGSLWLASANLDDARKTDALGAQTYSAGMLAEKVLSTLTDAETGQRGYLLTQDCGYLTPFEAARAIGPALETMRFLVVMYRILHRRTIGMRALFCLADFHAFHRIDRHQRSGCDIASAHPRQSAVDARRGRRIRRARRGVSECPKAPSHSGTRPKYPNAEPNR